MPFCIGGAQYNNFLHELIWVNSHAYLSRHDIDIQMYSLMYLFLRLLHEYHLGGDARLVV